MSIQSSVNALIGSVGAIKTARDIKVQKQAMMTMQQQRIALAQQRTKIMAQKEKRLKAISPILAQTELQKARNERHRLGTERMKLRQEIEKEKKDGTTKAL